MYQEVSHPYYIYLVINLKEMWIKIIINILNIIYIIQAIKLFMEYSDIYAVKEK